MIKVKDGYAKLIGTTYSGSVSRVLLSNGGDHILGNSSGNIPLNNGTINTNLNADMLDGLHIHAGRNNEANKIVRTDANGYILAGWINTTSGNIGTGTINKIYCSNDDYIRYKTPANFFETLANDGNQISITVGSQNRKLTVNYASFTKTLDKVSLPSSTSNAANTAWCKFARITFNNSAWSVASGYLFFGGEENPDNRAILVYHFRSGNTATTLSTSNLYWLVKSYSNATVIAVKAADNVYDLYTNNSGTYLSPCIYHMSAFSNRFTWSIGNWTTTKPTAAYTSSDIGIVNYANSAGNADTVDGLHLYTRNLGINGSSWTFASTANANATTHIYAATSAGTSGQILKSTGGTPAWMNQSDLTAGKVTCTVGTADVFRPIVLTNESNQLYYNTKIKGNYSTGKIQLSGIEIEDAAGNIPLIRFGSANKNSILWKVYSNDTTYANQGVYGFDMTYFGTGSGNANRLVLHADNQNSATKVEAMSITQDGVVTFSKTISGSINGNANTVDGQHFNWNNNKNDHTYLWAATDNGNAYLVHRASISVNYANSAGSASSATKVDWSGVTNKPCTLISYSRNSESIDANNWKVKLCSLIEIRNKELTYSNLPMSGYNSFFNFWTPDGIVCTQFQIGDGAFYYRSKQSSSATITTSWHRIMDSNNCSISKSEETLTVKINGTNQSLTNTWRGILDNLTSSTNTTQSLSAKQGYLLANGSARDNTKLPLSGGTMTGTIKYGEKSYEIIRTGGDNTSYRSGLKYSWSGNTTIALWGKHSSTQFVWHAGTDFSSVDVNGTATRTYDFQVGRVNGTLEALIGGNKIWHAGNDGSGSGLDADLLDGNHASAFATAGHTHNYDNVYSKLGHTHDDRYYTESEINSKLSAYLPLSGGTMTGVIKSTYTSGSWIGGVTNAILKGEYTGYGAILSMPVKDGRVSLSSYPASNNFIYFGYATTAQINAGTNSFNKQMYWDAANNNLHADVFIGSLSGNASTASKWLTARTLTIGNTGKSVNGSGNVSWSLAEIGAATSGHTHTLSLASDTGTSSITLAHGGKYKLTAGGNSVIFTLPTDNNTNPANYYWANVKVSAASSTSTAPQFGKVKINTTSSTYQLNVSGDSYVTGWSRAGKGLYLENSGIYFAYSDKSTTTAEIDLLSNNEFCWGANSDTLYFNFKLASRNATTVTKYVWNAGSSNSYATHTTGDIILGDILYQLKREGHAASWYLGRDTAIVRQTNYSETTVSEFYAIISSKTYNGSWEITTYYEGLYFSYVSDNDYNNANTLHLTPIHFTGSACIYATHFYEYSDIRYKKILRNLSINSNTIATLPLFDFKWIENNAIGTGTSALAVLLILPNLVSGTDRLTLDYGVLGTIAGITACKELVTLKSELLQLKEKIKELEDKLRKYENI